MTLVPAAHPRRVDAVIRGAPDCDGNKHLGLDEARAGEAAPAAAPLAFAPDDPECPFNWSLRRRILIVVVMCLQILWATMLSAIYGAAVAGISRDLHVSELVARIPQATYLIGFAIGPVVLTPFAEDYGRKHIYTACIVLLWLLQIPCALAHSIYILMVVRFFAGCLASPLLNSVGCIPDLFTPDEPMQGYLVNGWAHTAELIILGTLIGGYIDAAQGWRWIFWYSMIVGFALLVPYLLLVPETRGNAILARRARQLRKDFESGASAQPPPALQHRAWGEIVQETLIRPAEMLFTEPAVFLFGLWDGLSYALVFILQAAYPLIYSRHGLSTTQIGLTFIAAYIGTLVGLLLYPLQRKAEQRLRIEKGPEVTLLWAFVAAVLLPVSLWWFAFTIQPSVHWIVSLLASAVFGIAGHIIFIAASAYVIEAYGDYASSAVTGQTFLREAMSASVSIVSATFYENVGNRNATIILAAIATAMLPIPFVFYAYGPRIRAKSKFLRRLAEEKELALSKAELEQKSCSPTLS